MRTIGAVVKNDKGQLLPYTCQSTMSQCEEKAASFFSTAWPRLQELGAKVVQVEIIETEDDLILSKELRQQVEAIKAAWAIFSQRHGEARDHSYGCEVRHGTRSFHDARVFASCSCGLWALDKAIKGDDKPTNQ